MSSSAAAQVLPVVEPICKVCKRPPANGKLTKGMCQRDYFRELRATEKGLKPVHTPEPRKREPGTWTNLQVHVDAKLAAEFRKAAKGASQTLGAWLEDAIRAKLSSSNDDED